MRAVFPGQVPKAEIVVDDEVRTVSARLIIGADGRESQLATLLDFERHRDPPELFTGGLQLAGDIPTEQALHFFLHGISGRGSILIRTKPGNYRIYLLHHKDALFRRLSGRRDYGAALEHFREIGIPPHWLEGVVPHGIFATFDGAHRWITKPVRGNCVLIGDAAGASDPVWGNGLSRTLRDVRLLRDRLLSERDWPDGERRTISRAAWSFVPPGGGAAATEITLDGGFKPGRIYELTYTARDPMVVAAGMAGIRDLMSYLRNNPLVGAPAPQASIIFGISQSGRLIQTILLRGLHVDEDGRSVFDGAFIHVAGGGKGGFDYRFAMPTRHFSMLEDHIYPTDFFPFATTAARDPVTGVESSVLDRARALGAIPKLFYVNNSSEYWNRAASLIATDPAGMRDLKPVPEVRIYLIAGAQHYVGTLRERGIFANCVNTLNHYRIMRALMLAFDRWVRDGVEPPPSTYPRIADGTLVTIAAHALAFPRIPDFRLPEGNLRPPRLDLGSRFETERIADEIPPITGKPFETLVPKPNADGLDQGGIALPEVLVPLGTRTGFNTRNDAAGFPWATGRWDGSFVPFPRTDAERQASGDPRPSLQGRYANRAVYEAKIRSAAAAVVALGFLLPEDVGALVDEAGGLYDRIKAHDPAERSCEYLFSR